MDPSFLAAIKKPPAKRTVDDVTMIASRIRSIAFFGPFDDARIQTFAEVVRLEAVDSLATLTVEDHFVILHGLVDVFSVNQDGSRTPLVRLGSGESFGDQARAQSEMKSVIIETKVKTELLRIERSKFDKITANVRFTKPRHSIVELYDDGLPESSKPSEREIPDFLKQYIGVASSLMDMLKPKSQVTPSQWNHVLRRTNQILAFHPKWIHFVISAMPEEPRQLLDIKVALTTTYNQIEEMAENLRTKYKKRKESAEEDATDTAAQYLHDLSELVSISCEVHIECWLSFLHRIEVYRKQAVAAFTKLWELASSDTSTAEALEAAFRNASELLGATVDAVEILLAQTFLPAPFSTKLSGAVSACNANVAKIGESIAHFAAKTDKERPLLLSHIIHQRQTLTKDFQVIHQVRDYFSDPPLYNTYLESSGGLQPWLRKYAAEKDASLRQFSDHRSSFDSKVSVLKMDPSMRDENAIKELVEDFGTMKAFANFTTTARQRFARVVRFVEIPKAATYLLKQGDPESHWFIVYQGSVDVIVDGVTICALEEGNSFGEIGLAKDRLCSASIRTREPQCQFITCGKEDYKAIMESTEKDTRRIEENGKVVMILERGGKQNEYNVMAGTAVKLIEKLVNDQDTDELYLETFLTCWRIFITADELWTILLNMFNATDSPDPGLPKKIAQLVVRWLREYSIDFSNDVKLLQYINTFIVWMRAKEDLKLEYEALIIGLNGSGLTLSATELSRLNDMATGSLSPASSLPTIVIPDDGDSNMRFASKSEPSTPMGRALENDDTMLQPHSEANFLKRLANFKKKKDPQRHPDTAPTSPRETISSDDSDRISPTIQTSNVDFDFKQRISLISDDSSGERMIRIYRLTVYKTLRVDAQSTAASILSQTIPKFNLESSGELCQLIQVFPDGTSKVFKEDQLILEHLNPVGRIYLGIQGKEEDMPPPEYDENDRPFLMMDVEEFAKALTRLEVELLSDIEPVQYIYSIAKIPGKDVDAIDKMTRHFNSVALWVSAEILAYDDIIKRLYVLRKFIELASITRNMQNFNSTLAILSGLSNHAVSRLKNTWKKLSSKVTHEFNSLMKYLDPSWNMKQYRTVLSEAQPPLVPFFPLLMKDLFFIYDSQSAKTNDGLLNFDKARSLFTIIGNIREYLKYPYKDIQPAHSSSSKKRSSLRASRAVGRSTSNSARTGFSLTLSRSSTASSTDGNANVRMKDYVRKLHVGLPDQSQLLTNSKRIEPTKLDAKLSV